jgi:hypothetical protein
MPPSTLTSRPEGLKGSARHIRWYANQGEVSLTGEIFDAFQTLAAAASSGVRWVSPRPPDYRELWNERFMQGIGRPDLMSAFKAFWPHSGTGTPHWDAVGLVDLQGGDTGVVLVEAKSHLVEFDKPSDASTAGELSLATIAQACLEARGFYGVSKSSPDWASAHYQVANRYTHLWWLDQVQGIPTWLVWAFICDDPDWQGTGSVALDKQAWSSRFQQVIGKVGIPKDHQLSDRVGAVYLAPAPPE